MEAERLCPFTIVIDSNEGNPFPFRNLRDLDGEPVIVPVTTRPLYLLDRPRWGTGVGDYSILGHERAISIERKELGDLYGTLLGRREQFELQIRRMNDQHDFSAVMVESPWSSVLRYQGQETDPKKMKDKQRSVEGTYYAWRQRYPAVHWFFCESRYEAQQISLHLFYRWWSDFQRGKLPRQSPPLENVLIPESEPW